MSNVRDFPQLGHVVLFRTNITNLFAGKPRVLLELIQSARVDEVFHSSGHHGIAKEILEHRVQVLAILE